MRGGEVVEGAAVASASTSTSSSSSSMSTTAIRNRRKMKTLEDLFRPPIDLIYRGTFQAVSLLLTKSFFRLLNFGLWSMFETRTAFVCN